MVSDEFKKRKENECPFCHQKIKNKMYLKHRAETHKDSKAIELLEELEQL